MNDSLGPYRPPGLLLVAAMSPLILRVAAADVAQRPSNTHNVWTTARKVGVGKTFEKPSKVWFTLADGSDYTGCGQEPTCGRCSPVTDERGHTARGLNQPFEFKTLINDQQWEQLDGNHVGQACKVNDIYPRF